MMKENLMSKDFMDKVFKLSVWLSFIVIVLYLSFQFTDSDLYYIIPTGRYILSNGIPHENPFITTPGQGIIIQNWLYCAIVALIYNTLHSFGLWLLQLGLILGMIAVIFIFLDFKKSNNKTSSIFAVLIILALFGYINLRPEMLTFILIMVEIIGIEKYRDTGKAKYLWTLPLTILLEINCHASYWIMHFVVLLPYIVTPIKHTRTKDSTIPLNMSRKLIIPMISMIIVLFINPYGVDAILYTYYALTSKVVTNMGIAEQFPFSVTSPYVWIYAFVMILFFAMWWKKKLTSTELYMYVGFSIAFIWAIKWLPFYVIALAFLTRAGLKTLNGKNIFETTKPKVSVIRTILILFLLFFLILNLCSNNNVVKCFDLSSDEYLDRDITKKHSPYDKFAKMADYLDDNDPDASVFAIFSNANYFEYRGYKVFFDARPELYTEEIAGSDEIASVFFKVKNSMDTLAYLDEKKSKSSDDIDIEKYCLSAKEYAETIDNINVDYYVVSTSMALLYHYIDSNPGKYTCVVDCGQYKLYRRK